MKVLAVRGRPEQRVDPTAHDEVPGARERLGEQDAVFVVTVASGQARRLTVWFNVDALPQNKRTDGVARPDVIVDLYLDGRLHLDELIAKRISLGDINGAFDAMRTGNEARSIIVF